MDTVMRKQTHSSSFLLNIYRYCLGKLVPLEIVYFYASPDHTVRGFFWRKLQRKAVQLPYFKLRWQNEISFSQFHYFKTKILNRYVKSKKKKTKTKKQPF